MCRIAIRIFAAFYLLALALLLVGTYGLFGAEQDPLAGIFLLPLGLPWTLVTGRLPEALMPYGAALAPALNLVVLVLICRWVGAR